MHRLLAFSMLVGMRCAFLAGPDLHDQMMTRKLAGRATPPVVVTLNYDLLVEDAFARATRRFTYPNIPGVEGTIFMSPGSGEAVPIYKIHGSINWLAVHSTGHGADLETARRNTKPLRLVRSGKSIVGQTYATYVPQGRDNLFYELEEHDEDPVVALYRTGKRLLWNPEHVDGHRATCLATLTSLGDADVIAVGVRPVSKGDDPVLGKVIELLASMRGEKEYVSPSATDCDAFQRFGFYTRNIPLQSWIRDHA